MKNSCYKLKKLFFLVFLLSFYNLINAQITDHLGANWTISSNQTATGTHINVGIFTVAGGDTLFVTGNELNVNAQSVNIIGVISADGKGGTGGTGPALGGGPSNTTPGCSGGILGIAGTGGGYTGGGLNGSNGVTGGQGYTGGTQVCYFAGGGGGGAGAGGSYGGLGGVGANGANAVSFNSGAILGGTGGAGGNASPVYGSISNQLVDWGSGGGSAGSGGGGFTAGSSGGNGGNGGGKITISSNGTTTISGNITSNGTNGGKGGNGASSSPGNFTYSCSPVSTTSICVQSPSVYVGAGGAGGGGGGGSGGGILIISCGLVNITGGLEAVGGNGGDAGSPTTTDGVCFNDAQAGAGGGGGRIKIFANSCNNNIITPVLSVAGGSAGTIGNTGNQGNTGTFLDTTFVPVITPGFINSAQTICAGDDPVAFTSAAGASLSCGSSLYQWLECTSGCGNPPTNYSSISGATTDVYDSPPIFQTTYFVRQAYMGSCSGFSNVLIVTVNPSPIDPDTAWVNRQNFCSNDPGNISLTISGGSGNTVGWYTGSCGGTLIGTGNPFIYPSPTVTTTFYANWQTPTCGVSTCAHSVVVVNVNQLPVQAVSATVDTTGFCANYAGNITLSISGGSGEQVGWYIGSCPGTGISSSIGNGNPITVPAPSLTTIYYGRWETALCGSTPCVSIPVVVNLPPSAMIGSNSPVCSGGAINLTSGGGTVYLWSGPGFNSNTQNPNISNASSINAGQYFVTVTDVHSCYAVDSTNVVVYISPDPPSGAVADRSNFCANDTGTINLTTLGGSGAVIGWYSGSCGGVLIGTGALVTLPSPVITTIYYTRWETPYCGNSICNQVTVVVNQMPVAVVGSNSPTCSEGTINLNASGGATYIWLGPNGFASATSNPVIPLATVASSGTYYVTITSTGACSVIDSLKVIVNPSVVSTISNNSPVCYGDTLKFFADSTGNIAQYAWSGPNVFNSSLQNPTINYATTAASGTYSLVVTNIYGCTNSANMLVTVPSKLSVNVPSDIHLCNGTTFNISANATGGNAPYAYFWGDSLSNPTISVSPTHDSIYTVKVIDALGCSIKGNVHVFVPLPVVLHLYLNRDTICKNTSAIITANISQGIGAPYLVYLNDGTIISPPWIVSPDSSQTYIITAKDGCGFKSTDTIRLIVVPAPDVVFTSDVSAGCQALHVHFNDEDQYTGQHYFWNFGDGYTDETDTQNPFHIYQSDGIYNVTLTVTSSLGCATTVTQNDMITVYKRPQAIFFPDNNMVSIINPIIHFDNKSTFGVNYYWSFNDGDSSNVISPIHEYKKIGNYNVKLIAESINGCRDTTIKLVKVLQEFTFYAPTAFSPNNDGKNDIFTIFSNGIDPDNFEMFIYDRWGEIVYHTKQYDIVDPKKYGWDGSIKGKSGDAKSDSYTWLVVYKDMKGVEHKNAGTVTIVK